MVYHLNPNNEDGVGMYQGAADEGCSAGGCYIKSCSVCRDARSNPL